MFLFLCVRDILKRTNDRNPYTRLTFGLASRKGALHNEARASRKSRRHCSTAMGMPNLSAKRPDLSVWLLPRRKGIRNVSAASACVLRRMHSIPKAA